MEKYLVLATLVGAVIALAFALHHGQARSQLLRGHPPHEQNFSIHPPRRQRVSEAAIHRCRCVFACMIVVLCIMAACKLLTWFVPFAFLTGGFFSGLSGFVGMRIATKANCRTANACREGLNKGLRVAFSRWQRHGLHRGGPGPSGHLRLVLASSLCF